MLYVWVEVKMTIRMYSMTVIVMDSINWPITPYNMINACICYKILTCICYDPENMTIKCQIKCSFTILWYGKEIFTNTKLKLLNCLLLVKCKVIFDIRLFVMIALEHLNYVNELIEDSIQHRLCNYKNRYRLNLIQKRYHLVLIALT